MLREVGQKINYVNNLIGEGKSLRVICGDLSEELGYRVPIEILRKAYSSVTSGGSLDLEIRYANRKGVTIERIKLEAECLFLSRELVESNGRTFAEEVLWRKQKMTARVLDQ